MKKQNPVVYFALVLFLLGLDACTKARDSGLSHEIWLPWLGQNGIYSVQKVQVNTVSEWSPLRGTAAQLRSHIEKVDESTFSSQEVVLEYSHDKSGAIVPLTQFSTEVAAIYANFERLQKLDKELGLPDADLARKVYIKFLDYQKDGSFSINNAAYDASIDSFYIVPYRLSGLPLSVNGGVLAHEHFHSIFARLIWLPLNKDSISKGKKIFNLDELSPHVEKFTKVFSESRRAEKIGSFSLIKKSMVTNRTEFLNHAIFKGLNEGLADIWGWLYSSDPCFMSLSLEPDRVGGRCLNSDSSKLRFTSIKALGAKFSSFEDGEAQAGKYGYELGSNLAQMIYLRIEERGELKDPVALHNWAKRITETLPTYLPNMIKVKVDGNMNETIFEWEKMVDSLLFGPGSVGVPKEKCSRWESVFQETAALENLKSKCSK